MAETFGEIPDRELFKPSEVCEIAKLQPYVLRSWEQEFPGLGVARAPGAPRVYRRADVELVLKIRHLVFSEGLTLAGARRRIEGDGAWGAAGSPAGVLVLDDQSRERLASIKQEIRSLVSLLADRKPAVSRAQPDVASGGAGTWPAPRVTADEDGDRPAPRKRAGSRRR